MDFLLEGLLQAVKLLVQGNPETYSAVWATVKVSSYSMATSLLFGIPLGFCLGYFEFSGKKPLRTVVDTLMALPTVFIGLLVYAFLTRRGPLGDWGLLFTLPGIAIGQAILALPIVIGLGQSAAAFFHQFMGSPARTAGRRDCRLRTRHDGSGDFHDGRR